MSTNVLVLSARFNRDVTENLKRYCEKSPIDLFFNNILNKAVKDHSIITFWVSVSNNYPVLAAEVIKVLLPFCTTYLRDI